MTQSIKLGNKIPGNVSLPNSTQYLIQSLQTKSCFKIFIAEPLTQPQSQKGYPVLYLLDANTTFLMATEMVRLLEYTKELPQILIVGIGYQDATLASIGNRRIKEFTPTPDPDYKKIWSSEFAIKSNGGEAPLFLRFLQKELKPFIESHYPVIPHANTLAGDSLGGLFALYTMFQNSSIFSQYIIGSPAIFWDNGILWEFEKYFYQQHKRLEAKIFLSVGDQEDAEPYHFPENHRTQMSHISLVGDTCKMINLLQSRNYKGLELHSHIFEGETHMSVIAPWLNRGLRTLFQNCPTSSHKY